jgi:hypothetical protein
MNTEEYIGRIKEVAALLGICFAMWLLLNHGIPLQMEQQDIRNQQRLEAQK